MRNQLKRQALTWLHKVLFDWLKSIEQALKTLEPFTMQDCRDEILNRYPF